MERGSGRGGRGDDERHGRVHVHEVESLRRSLAMSDQLARGDVERVLDTCEALLTERVRIERVLSELGPAWGGARRALNELHKIIRA